MGIAVCLGALVSGNSGRRVAVIAAGLAVIAFGLVAYVLDRGDLKASRPRCGG